MVRSHQRELPGPPHFPSGSTPERRKSVRTGKTADAQGCEAGPCTDGRYQLLPQLFARLVQDDGMMCIEALSP